MVAELSEQNRAEGKVVKVTAGPNEGTYRVGRYAGVSCNNGEGIILHKILFDDGAAPESSWHLREDVLTEEEVKRLPKKVAAPPPPTAVVIKEKQEQLNALQ